MPDQPHDIDSPNCWCIPYIQKMCPLCMDEDGIKEECAGCDGEGWVQATVEEYYDETIPCIVIHNAFQ